MVYIVNDFQRCRRPAAFDNWDDWFATKLVRSAEQWHSSLGKGCLRAEKGCYETAAEQATIFVHLLHPCLPFSCKPKILFVHQHGRAAAFAMEHSLQALPAGALPHFDVPGRRRCLNPHIFEGLAATMIMPSCWRKPCTSESPPMINLVPASRYTTKGRLHRYGDDFSKRRHGVLAIAWSRSGARGKLVSLSAASTITRYQALYAIEC